MWESMGMYHSMGISIGNITCSPFQITIAGFLPQVRHHLHPWHQLSTGHIRTWTQWTQWPHWVGQAQAKLLENITYRICSMYLYIYIPEKMETWLITISVSIVCFFLNLFRDELVIGHRPPLNFYIVTKCSKPLTKWNVHPSAVCFHCHVWLPEGIKGLLASNSHVYTAEC